MTEPNVLGNVSPAKFLWETGNTEIINLFRDEWNDSATISLMKESAGTLAGVTYVVPANRVFYLLSLEITKQGADVQLNIQSNTSADTSVGGTTKARIFQENSNDPSPAHPHALCIKFVATEYVTPYFEAGGNVYLAGWGIECDV